MVLQVVLLELLVVQGKTVHDVRLVCANCREARSYSLAVVEEIVGQVIADVSEDTAAEHLHGRIPVVEENGVG